MALLACNLHFRALISRYPALFSIFQFAIICTMSSKEKRVPYYVAPQPNTRKLRRRVVRWVKANGLTIVLVSAMLVFAWMIAER
jgi:hypothetical protein